MLNCIKTNLGKLPEFDMVVGIPRSGMIPAYIIGLFLNKPVCSVDELVNNILPSNGFSRQINPVGKKILIVDDSIYSGKSINYVKNRLQTSNIDKKYKIKYLAIYAHKSSINIVDYYFEIVPVPRFFQWNYLNVKHVNEFCFDLDGVLCVDPTPEENDDGEKYIEFIKNAKPLHIPKYKIRAIVTSRLEKYRKETEEWLLKNNILYDDLFMLNLKSKEERIKSNVHSKFKASVYSNIESVLFVESDEDQAKEIAKYTHKPCISVKTDTLYDGSEPYTDYDANLYYDEINKTKILLTTHEFTYTGAPHSLISIAKILLKNNFFVEVWGPSNGPFVEEFEKIGIIVKIVPYSSLKDERIKKIARKFDLCIVNTLISHQYYQFMRKYCPTIWFIREAHNIPDICKNTYQRKLLLQSGDRIYCVSEYAQRFIKKKYNSSVKVVHNYIDDRNDIEYSPSFRIEGKINFIQSGTISNRKAVHICLNAFLSLPDEIREKSALFFVGQLVPSNKKYWGPILEKIKQQTNVFYLGQINDDEKIMSLMKEMDVIIVPSLDDSCSRVALEGAMLSKPLILSENVGAKYLLSNDCGWLVKTGSVDALSSVMKYIIENPTCLLEKGRLSRLSYEEYSNYQVYESNILKMVNENICDLQNYRINIKDNPPNNIFLKIVRSIRSDGLRGFLSSVINHLKNLIS